MSRGNRFRLSVGVVAWLLIPAALLLFIGANAHLVYVAVSSQPDCVDHIKHAGDGDGYRAAKSSC